MKKMWIKKESLYHKPFYKQKLKMTMLGVLLLGILFFAYQVISLNQLPIAGTPHIDAATFSSNSNSASIGILAPSAGDTALHLGRGVRELDLARYQPTMDRTFRCLRSGELFNASKLNDDYCDCADGSDEPATNACPNGRFYCAHRARHPRAGVDGQRHIPSSRVNDGICDCCDGSDEWLPHRRNGGNPAKCVNRCG